MPMTWRCTSKRTAFNLESHKPDLTLLRLIRTTRWMQTPGMKGSAKFTGQLVHSWILLLNIIYVQGKSCFHIWQIRIEHTCTSFLFVSGCRGPVFSAKAMSSDFLPCITLSLWTVTNLWCVAHQELNRSSFLSSCFFAFGKKIQQWKSDLCLLNHGIWVSPLYICMSPAQPAQGNFDGNFSALCQSKLTEHHINSHLMNLVELIKPDFSFDSSSPRYHRKRRPTPQMCLCCFVHKKEHWLDGHKFCYAGCVEDFFAKRLATDGANFSIRIIPEETREAVFKTFLGAKSLPWQQKMHDASSKCFLLFLEGFFSLLCILVAILPLLRALCFRILASAQQGAEKSVQ